jgi:hypothetical protein
MAAQPVAHAVWTDCPAFQEQSELLSGMALGRRYAVRAIQGQLISTELLNPPTKSGWVDIALTRYVVELPPRAILRLPDDRSLEPL